MNLIDLHRAIETLSARLAARLPESAPAWLTEARAKVRADSTVLAASFPAVSRRTGRGPLLASAGREPARLFGDSGPILDAWRIDDAARVVLLLEDAAREPAGAMGRACQLYFAGEARERIAVLRALQLVHGGDEGLAVVKDALRVNAVDLFAAAICENLYTSARLPDPLFFQAVLKAAFVGLALFRIERVEERTTPELVRMLFAYVTEREAAGRPVAADLWPLVAIHAPAGAQERIRRRLSQCADAEERRLLEGALSRAKR